VSPAVAENVHDFLTEKLKEYEGSEKFEPQERMNICEI
jgi:hypothetical protein